MKTSTLLLTVPLLLFACKKTHDTTPSASISLNDSFHAVVNGNALTAFDFGGTYHYPPTLFFIEAHSLGQSSNSSFNITFPDRQSPSHYDLAISQSAVIVEYMEDTTHFTISAGSLDIVTSNSNYVMGRFGFTATAGGKTNTITDGYFLEHR